VKAGEARIGKLSGAMAVEQLSALLVWRRRAGEDRRVIISHPLRLSEARERRASFSRKGWGTRDYLRDRERSFKAWGTRQGSKQDWKPLSKQDIKALKDAGYDVHDLKPNSRYDLYRNANGDISVFPKGNLNGPGDPTGLNIKGGVVSETGSE
jgi:hypothetical protein